MKQLDNKKNYLYRKDIDGLRAIAVFVVIFYHMGLPLFHAGYIGVDIFFVISGYLISSIILKDIENRKFDIKNFYIRRIRRILPILLLVVTLSLIFFYKILLPYQLIDFSKSALSTLGFFSNFYFLLNSGYFSPGANELPLLHTWSLSIEEQFYIFYPLILIFFLTYLNKKKYIFIFFIILILSSLALAQFGGNLKTTYPFLEKNFSFFNQSYFASFFMTFGRIWELLIGYYLCLIFRKNFQFSLILRNLISMLGAILIIISLFIFNKDTPHPSLITLLPVAGTSFILIFSNHNTFIYKILSYKILVWLGLISYSLYLWHHPILIFLNFTIDDLNYVYQLIYIISVIIISFFSWKYFELPFRNYNIVSNKFLLIFVLISYSSIILLSIYFISKKGFLDSYKPEDQQFVSYNSAQRGDFVRSKFNLSKKNEYDQSKVNVLLIGDSQAQDFFNVLSFHKDFNRLNIKTIYISAKCQIFFKTKTSILNIPKADRFYCSNEMQLNESLTLIKKYQVIILAANWKKWSADLINDTVDRLELSNNQKIYVVGPKHFGKININKYIGTTLEVRLKLFNNLKKHTKDVNNLLKSKSKNYDFINLVEKICSNNQCKIFDKQGQLISHDGNHLTASGAKYISSQIKLNLF